MTEEKQRLGEKMTSLVRRLSWSLQWVALSRQLTVGAALSAKGESAKSQTVQDPVKKLFLDKIKVAMVYLHDYLGQKC